MKSFGKMLLLNLTIIIVAVVCYSDGLLKLRPSDPSIIRAGLSIIIGLGLAAALVLGNIKLLRKPKRKDAAELTDPVKAEAALKELVNSRNFGRLARSAIDQLQRVDNSAERAEYAVKMKFQEGNMTENRYSSVIAAARQTVCDNVTNIAVRMQIFDDREYARLRSYRKDGVPDEIQEKQLALYGSNVDRIKEIIAANEKLILRIDTLALEISDSNERDSEPTELLVEITRLSGELKYYS